MERYKRVEDTTAEYFVYDGANVVDSYASNGNLNARYITPGLDRNLSMTRGGSTYYYMADGLALLKKVVTSSMPLEGVTYVRLSAHLGAKSVIRLELALLLGAGCLSSVGVKPWIIRPGSRC